MIRFAMWDDVLAAPGPPAKLNALTGGWRYARTVALAAKGRLDEARIEVTELEKLAAALLNAGNPREAEAVYRADLVRNPENGWALFGLAAALQAQGHERDAAAVRQRFEKAWAHADIVLTASAY